MNPSDFQHGHATVMSSRLALVPSPPPCRLSQVPRLICPRALSPTTPGGPMAACTRCFTIGSGLHHSLAGWPRSTSVTRPNRVRLRYGSRVRSAGLRHVPPAPLPAERAICRITTFQVIRSARLILALPEAQRTQRKAFQITDCTFSVDQTLDTGLGTLGFFPLVILTSPMAGEEPLCSPQRLRALRVFRPWAQDSRRWTFYSGSL